jgi:hypothetical protein
VLGKAADNHVHAAPSSGAPARNDPNPRDDIERAALTIPAPGPSMNPTSGNTVRSYPANPVQQPSNFDSSRRLGRLTLAIVSGGCARSLRSLWKTACYLRAALGYWMQPQGTDCQERPWIQRVSNQSIGDLESLEPAHCALVKHSLVYVVYSVRGFGYGSFCFYHSLGTCFHNLVYICHSIAHLQVCSHLGSSVNTCFSTSSPEHKRGFFRTATKQLQ